MKEIQPHIKDETEIHAQKQEERGRQYVGTFNRQAGQTVWQINLRTQEISPVEYKEDFATIGGGTVKTIIKKELHWYCVALNKKNAGKKFNAMAKIVIENRN